MAEVRPYIDGDREDVLEIHFETGFLGRSMSNVLTRRREYNKDIELYLDRYPDFCFVADGNGGAAGYIVGIPDDSELRAVRETAKKALRVLLAFPFMPKKDKRFWAGWFAFLYRAATGKSEESKLKTPSESGHLHINVLEEYRGKGMGSKLLEAFILRAESAGVARIHADSFETRLDPNKDFWLKNGFREYRRAKTSFWKKQLPHENINIVCYLKELHK